MMILFSGGGGGKGTWGGVLDTYYNHIIDTNDPNHSSEVCVLVFFYEFYSALIILFGWTYRAISKIKLDQDVRSIIAAVLLSLGVGKNPTEYGSSTIRLSAQFNGGAY